MDLQDPAPAFHTGEREHAAVIGPADVGLLAPADLDDDARQCARARLSDARPGGPVRGVEGDGTAEQRTGDVGAHTVEAVGGHIGSVVVSSLPKRLDLGLGTSHHDRDLVGPWTVCQGRGQTGQQAIRIQYGALDVIGGGVFAGSDGERDRVARVVRHTVAIDRPEAGPLSVSITDFFAP